MQLYDAKLEMTTLRAITESKNKTEQARLLARMHPDHFYDDVSVEVFQRVRKVVNRQSRIPDWSELMVDPVLSESARAELENYKDLTPLRRRAKFKATFEGMDRYRKARILFFNSERTLAALEKDKVDIDELLTSNADQLVSAQISSVSDKEILTIGANSNSGVVLEKLLSNERASVVRTGLDAFDGQNGGIMPGSLWVIAATSGGGKSAMGNQLGINMAKNGNKVCLVPLEMSEEETMARVVANVAEIDVKKFLFTSLTENEQEHARKAFHKFEDKAAKLDGAFRIFEPETDLGIEEILTLLRPYGDDVVMIDYIGLLKGVDGDDSWQALGNAARYAKVWAKNNKKIVVLMAQLSDEGAIRYSKAVKEHANNMWSWVYGDENRETGIIDIVQQKARNQAAFDFQIGHDFATMRIFDVDGPMDEGHMEARRSKKGKEKHRKLADATIELNNEVDQYLEDRSSGARQKPGKKKDKSKGKDKKSKRKH